MKLIATLMILPSTTVEALACDKSIECHITVTAKEDFVRSLGNATTEYGQLDIDLSSFSMDVYSLHEPSALLTHHFSAPTIKNLSQGVSEIDSNTIYRLGSTSKLLTVYAYLAAVGDTSWNDPITKYIPELDQYAREHAEGLTSDTIDLYDWTEVTIGSLASQLSGIPRDAPSGPLQDTQYASAGLPSVPSVNASYCGTELYPLLCNRTELFKALLPTHPVYSPSYGPIYSNAAFTMLGLALESIIGSPLAELFSSKLSEPLGLNSTTYSRPTSNDSSIIISDSVYFENFGYDTPAGGYFSTINDMRRIGKSILNSTLLTRSQTNRWLKPQTFTSIPTQFVGGPCEIYQASINDDTTYIYTKLWDVPGYASFIALLPDYDIGITILGTGPIATANTNILSNLAIASYLPAIDLTARSEATSTYAGSYSDESTNSSITISVSPTGPGLLIESWTPNGQDFLQEIASLQGAGDSSATVRLYPSRLGSSAGNSTQGWRAIYEILPKPVNPGLFNQNCATWAAVDNTWYGGIDLDEFAFVMSEDNSVATAIEPRFLCESLRRDVNKHTRRHMTMWRA